MRSPLSVRPSVRPSEFSALFSNVVPPINFICETCINGVKPHAKFEFQGNRVIMTYFMAKIRSNLIFAFLSAFLEIFQ